MQVNRRACRGESLLFRSLFAAKGGSQGRFHRFNFFMRPGKLSKIVG